MTSEMILQPIETIKMVRGLTNCSLKDGKDLVFALRDGDVPAYVKALEKIRAETYGPDTAELLTQVESLTEQLSKLGVKAYQAECEVDRLNRSLNEANQEATLQEKYIKGLRDSDARMTKDLDNFRRENAELRDAAHRQSIVKAPLIDREVAKRLVLSIHEGRISEALALILEAAMPTETPPPKRTCTNCDPGPHEQNCNTCQDFSNWQEDMIPF